MKQIRHDSEPAQLALTWPVLDNVYLLSREKQKQKNLKAKLLRKHGYRLYSRGG